MSGNPIMLERDTLALLQRAFSDPRLPAPLRRGYPRSLAWNYRVLAGNYYHARRPWQAARCLLQALRHGLGPAMSTAAPDIERG
jgi:hypothetical protein